MKIDPEIEKLMLLYNDNINKNKEEAYKYAHLIVEKLDKLKEHIEILSFFQYALSIYYESKKDFKCMKKYLEESFKNGNKCAGLILGSNYLYGENEFEKNINKALIYLFESCLEGNDLSCKIAISYLNNNELNILEKQNMKKYIKNNRELILQKLKKASGNSILLFFNLLKQIRSEKYARKFLIKHIGFSRVLIKLIYSLFTNVIKDIFNIKNKYYKDCGIE